MRARDGRKDCRRIKSEKTMLLELLDKMEKDFREASIGLGHPRIEMFHV